MRAFPSTVVLAKKVAVLLVLSVLFAAGYAIAEHQLFPYPYIKAFERIGGRILPIAESKLDEEKDFTRISTTALRLNVKEVAVPLQTKGAGGGLTSYGDELVVVSFRGELFVVNSDTVSRTAIQVPDNGYEAFVRVAAREKYQEYMFLPVDFGIMTFSTTVMMASMDSYFRTQNTLTRESVTVRRLPDWSSLAPLALFLMLGQTPKIGL